MAQIKKSIRNEMRREIKRRLMTTDTAAAKIGVSRQSFSGYLNGKTTPREKTAIRMRRFFNGRWTLPEIMGIQ